jgi:citrate lyase subunit beta/citryl-CoA lyase
MTPLGSQCSIESIAQARSILFVPGDRPDRFAKAASAGADLIVIDLEDGVAPERKSAARANVVAWRNSGGEAVVRINAVGTAWHDEDVAAVGTTPTVVMVPKAEDPRSVVTLLGRLAPSSSVVAIAETAAGILAAPDLALVPGVVRMAFGNGDLATELGVDHRDHLALLTARTALVLASAAAGIAAPVDGVTTVLDDPEVVLTDSRWGRRLGFTGKMCIHPRQVPTVHAAFAPTASESEWARRVLAGCGDGGAANVDGEMVDRPLIARARRIAAQARFTSP